MSNLPNEISVPVNRLLQICSEITSLRQTNQVLQAQVNMAELFGLALKAPHGHGGYASSEDIVSVIQRALADAERVHTDRAKE